MAGFLDKARGFLGDYRNSALLTNLGAGLLAGSTSQHPGLAIQQGLLAGQNAIMNREKMDREKALFDLQMEQMRDEKQQRDSRGFAKAALFGGYDPSTNITWNQGRPTQYTSESILPHSGKTIQTNVGMSPNEQMGLLAQGYQDQYAGGLMGQLFKEPKPVKTVTLANPNNPAEVRSYDANTQQDEIRQMMDKRWYATSRSVQADKVSDLSPSKKADLQGEVNLLDQGIRSTREALAKIEQDPTSAGAVGASKGVLQTIVLVAGDLAVAGLNAIGEDSLAGKVDSKVKSMVYDPKVTELEAHENNIAYALARARKGKRGILNLQDFKNAKHDVNLIGLTSAEEAKTRLRFILGELERAKSSTQGILGGDKRPASELTDEELLQRIGEIE